MSEAVSGLDASVLSSYIAVREGTLPAGVSIAGITGMLESDNTLRLYLDFKGVSKDDFYYFIDDTRVELDERSDGRCYLAMRDGRNGVFSNHLQDTHTYSISQSPDGSDPYTITASVLTYARACAVKKGETEEIKNVRNLGKALYLYNRAAVAAFGE